MQAYRTRRGGQHVAAERGIRAVTDPIAKTVVVGLYRSFELWMRNNPELAGERSKMGCANAILVSHPEHIERVRGVDIGGVVVVDFLPGMADTITEIRSRIRRTAA